MNFLIKKYDLLFKKKISEVFKKDDFVYIELDLVQLLFLKQKNLTKNKFLFFFLKIIKKAIGPKGVIVAPSFSYTWAKKNQIYNKDQTPSKTGLFSNFFIGKKQIIRTLDPMFSCIIFSKNKKFLEFSKKTSFGSDSIFCLIHKLNAKLVTFGLDKFDPTFVHYVEQYYNDNIKNIKYRKNFEFEGYIKINEKVYKRKFNCFMRKKKSKIIHNEQNIVKDLQKYNLIKFVKFLNTKIYFCNAKDYFDIGIKGMNRNINYFIKT